MNQTCKLVFNDPHAAWFSTDKSNDEPIIHGRGYAFIENQFYQDQDLVDAIGSYFLNIPREDASKALKRIIPEMNGSWSMVASWEDGYVLAASDRNRSIPLLYAEDIKGYILSSSLGGIMSHIGGLEVDDTNAVEFVLSGYISGENTLFKNVYQIQAGEFIEFIPRKNDIQCLPTQYFKYFHEKPSDASEAELEEEFDALLGPVSQRLAIAMRGKQVYLPLSGGVDSRLIALWLKNHGKEDVKCFTYGVKNNPQVEIAKMVADALGYDWNFIEYNRYRWSDCMASKEMQAYWQYAFQGTSSPHIQEFPAAMDLSRTNNINNASVFLPGHVGDAWASEFALRSLVEKTNHPPNEYHSPFVPISGNEVVSAIVYRHLNLWPVRAKLWDKEVFFSLISKLTSNTSGYENSKNSPHLNFVEWVLRSRTSLWIVNAVRLYEFIGAGFYLSLGDYKIIDFFRKVPNGLLLGRYLYQKVIMRRILSQEVGVLGTVPLLSGVTRPKTFRRTVIDMFQTLHLFKPLDRARRSFRKEQNLSAESWFTNGRRPEHVSIRDALSPFLIDDYLPLPVLEIVKPILNKPAYSIQCNGLLAVAVLSTICKNIKYGNMH